MKIKNVEVFPIEYPLEYPSQDATGIWHNWSTVIVKVTAENNVCGYGEIGPIHGGGIPIFTAIVETRLKSLVVVKIVLTVKNFTKKCWAEAPVHMLSVQRVQL